MIQFGIDSESKTRSKLANLDMNLARGFVILEEGKESALGSSAIMLMSGLGIAVFLLIRRSKEDDTTPPPMPAPNLPPRE